MKSLSKLPRGLALRVVIISILASVIGGLFSVVPTMRVAAEQAVRRAMYYSLAGRELQAQRCQLDPEHWVIDSHGEQMFAYDRETLLSHNPAAPPLDLELYQRLQNGDPSPTTMAWRLPLGGKILIPLAKSGPCALAQANWRALPDANARGLRWMLVVQLLGLTVAGTLAILLAVRPLLRRIESLSQAANNIGDPESWHAPADRKVDDSLGRLGTQLEKSHHRVVEANESLARHAQVLEEHLQNVAHDVRTPLAALQLRLRGMLDDLNDLDGHGAQAEILTALDDVIYLTSLTENLHLASRLREGLDLGTQGTPLELGEVVQRVVNRFSVIGSLRGTRVRPSWPEESVWVQGDPVGVEQALANLVQNAVFYGPPGGEVTVLLDELDMGFELAVFDEGSSVSKEVLAQLRRRGFRGDLGRSRGPKGQGLGLAIVAEICARCGWTLAFETLEPTGLKVVIRGQQIDPPTEPMRAQ